MAFYMASDHTKEVSKLIKFKFKSRVLSLGWKLRAILKKGQEVEGKAVDNLKFNRYILLILCG